MPLTRIPPPIRLPLIRHQMPPRPAPSFRRQSSRAPQPTLRQRLSKPTVSAPTCISTARGRALIVIVSVSVRSGMEVDADGGSEAVKIVEPILFGLIAQVELDI